MQGPWVTSLASSSCRNHLGRGLEVFAHDGCRHLKESKHGMEDEKQWPEQAFHVKGGDMLLDDYHIKGFEPLILKSGCHCLTQSQALELEDKQPSGARPPIPGWVWGCGRSAHRGLKVALCPPWQVESRICLSGVGLFLGCALPCLCGFFFLANPQISVMLFWKIPAWLSHTKWKEGWAPTKRHLAFRAPGEAARRKASFGEEIQKSSGGVGLEGLFTPLPLSSLNTNSRNPGGPLLCVVVQRPTL